MSNNPDISVNASQNKLLYLLKTRGALTANEVSEQLRMTSMGARQHMQALEEKGLISHQFITAGKGRPKKKWHLTTHGESLFPDGHSSLLVNILGHMQTQLGESAMDQLIIAREKEMLSLYQSQLSKLKTTKAKLNKLALIRSNEGYMAEVVEENGKVLLVENHCPICAAANQCQQFCRSELSIFQQVLGCNVERVEYILEGARRCAYQIGD